MKASKLKAGHVLVDPEGHLYEVVNVLETGVGITSRPERRVHVWLWPDSSPVPNFYQTFDPEDDIVGINSLPNSATDETVVIPVVSE